MLLYLIGLLLCIIIAVLIGILTPKKAPYNKLDKAGFILNILLAVLYIPLSFWTIVGVLWFGDFSFFYPKALQTMIKIGEIVAMALPFISALSVMLSVIFRKRGKRKLSLIIQFIPVMIVIIIIVRGNVIHNFKVM